MAAAEQRVDRYELLGELASGGMATVYLGRQHGPFGFTRTVAIKSMHPQFAKDEGFRAMFLDEATLTARIRHPNVVPTLDIVAAESNVLLVMEYIEGVSLAMLLRRTFGSAEPPEKRRRVTPALASAIVCDALNGLHAAHELKDDDGQPLHVVHRDVSPQNIHVGTDGLGRVLDFGVAKAASRRYVTQSGEVKGKLAYMSKEQICGETVDLRTDVFAAGIVLWEMLAGRRLITANNEGAIIKLMLDSAFDPPSFFAEEEISPALDKVVMKALAPAKEDRWATAEEMASAVAAAEPPAPRHVVAAFVRELAAKDIELRSQRLRHGSGALKGDSVPQEVSALAELLTEHATVTFGPTVREQKSEVQAERKGKSRGRTAMLVAGGAVLVLGLVGGAFVVGSKSVRPPAQSAAPAATPPPASLEAPVASVVSAAAPPAPPPSTIASASAEPHDVKKPGTPPKKPPAPKKPDCRVPYVVDANGDRHYRSECVQ